MLHMSPVAAPVSRAEEFADLRDATNMARHAVNDLCDKMADCFGLDESDDGWIGGIDEFLSSALDDMEDIHMIVANLEEGYVTIAPTGKQS